MTTNKTAQTAGTWLALAAAALSTAVAPMQIKAEENAQPQVDVRARMERTESQNSSGDLTKFTLGVAPHNGNNGENLRIYDYQCEGMHYLTAGIKTPAFDLAGLTNYTTIFGSTGTREGAGIRPITSFSNFKLELNAEQDRTTAGKSSRLGADLEYKLANLTFNYGFDSVATPKGDFNYNLLTIMADLTKNDQVGLGFRTADTEKDHLNRIAGFYFHWGKDASWGTRSSIMYEWSNETDMHKLKWQSIIVSGIPTFIPIAGPLAIKRDTAYWQDTGITENPVDTIERTYTGKRTKGGIAFQSDGQITETAGMQSGTVRNFLGYTFPLGKANLSPGVYQQYDFTQKTDANTLGAGVLIRLPLTKKINLEAEVSAGKGVSGTANRMEYYGSLQFVRGF